jgi:hypothetical protein
MRIVAISLTLLALAAGPALACRDGVHASSFTCRGMGRDVHWAQRMDPSDARMAITSRNGEMTLMLTDRDVVCQLSDRAMHKVRRELKHAKDDQDNVLASVIVAVVSNTVGEVLDHSFVSHVRDLRDVSYDEGRLVFTGRHGRAVFADRHARDDDAMSGFSEDDSRAFVAEFRRVKAGQ